MRERSKERQPNDRLRQERLLRGWSQRQVANHVGTDDYTVGRWERGRARPGPYFRQQLCDLFGKDTEALGLLGERKQPAASGCKEPGEQEILSPPSRLTGPSVLRAHRPGRQWQDADGSGIRLSLCPPLFSHLLDERRDA